MRVLAEAAGPTVHVDVGNPFCFIGVAFSLVAVRGRIWRPDGPAAKSII